MSVKFRVQKFGACRELRLLVFRREKLLLLPGDSPGFLTDCLLSILFFGGYMYRTCCCVLLNCCVYMPRSQKGPLWRVFSFSFFIFLFERLNISAVRSRPSSAHFNWPSHREPALLYRERELPPCLYTYLAFVRRGFNVVPCTLLTNLLAYTIQQRLYSLHLLYRLSLLHI